MLTFIRKVTNNNKIVFAIWFSLAIIAAILELSRNEVNNYLIFKNVFWHTIHQVNLYHFYPNEYADHNLYGPIFSIIIAPFALLPDFVGCILWVAANSLILYKAIRLLPIKEKQQNIILLISAIECMTASHNVQSNPMLAACIILAFVFVQKQKDFFGALFIAIGFLVKLYGIIALIFFMFSKRKITFSIGFVVWLVALVALPILIASPKFIEQSYIDWYYCITEKNTINQVNLDMQNISVMGMAARIFTTPSLPNLYFIIPAGLLFVFPFLRFKQYKSTVFQLYFLASALLCVVLFSTSSESSTYIIAVIGASIWLSLQPPTKLNKALLIFMLLFTTLSSTDLLPHIFNKTIIHPYGLKALPCFVIWLIITSQLFIKKFVVNKESLHEITIGG